MLPDTNPRWGTFIPAPDDVDLTRYKAVLLPHLSEPWCERWGIVDGDTGELVDDAQGYGYTRAVKAYRGWYYKNKHKADFKSLR
jgi:hypothetical protein